MKGIWNNMRAVDVLSGLPEVDPGRIGAIGHSLGGHNAIFIALFDERIRAVVSSCGFDDFPHYNGGKIGGWSHVGVHAPAPVEATVSIRRKSPSTSPS